MHESGTLIDRAIRYLEIGPAESGVLATEVVGLCKTSDLVADRVVVALLGSDPRVSRLRDGRWALVAQAGGSPKIEDCTFAVVDVETTGGASRGRPDRVTEIAVVVVRGDSYELVLDTLVNPQRPIGRKASELTRITNADVRHQPVFGEIADKVTGELVGRVFVAHNVGFDWRLVSSELRRTTDRVLDGPRLCTAKLARRVVAGLKSRGLDSLAQYFGIEIEHRHRAGGDAVATARILIRLLDLARDRGARTLEDVQRLRRNGRRKSRRDALPRSLDEI